MVMTLRPVALALALGTSFVAPARAQDPVRPVGPGPGITNPVVVREEKPRYTQEALRQKIQGVVEVEAIILTDGRVGEVRIYKSLDRAFGLDEEALRAARVWRFTPLVKDGKPVPFRVIIQLEFRLDSQTIADADFERGAYSAKTEGLVLPKLKHEEKPKYSSEALRRKIQGVVEVQVVVGPDGKVDRARVAKSLDKEYGLDEEALRTARAWTFEPGTLNGAPVPVVVVIQLEFRVGK
jgi:TonB family protein